MILLWPRTTKEDNMRTRKCVLLLSVLISSFALTSVLAYAQAPPPTPLVVKKISDNVYWTQGGAGGNTGIIIGKDGVIVVDAKTTADSAREVLAEIAKLTPKPVTTAILTHSDGDHVNGLAAFPTSVTVIAQTNCKAEMEATVGGRNPFPKEHLPTKLVDMKEALTINGVRFQLVHFAPAHTAGDLIIYLADQKVAFTGDIVVTNQPDPYPIIHLNKHGTTDGWVQTIRGIIALKANNFVPGHGDMQTKASLQKLLASAQDRREQIKKLVAQGKPLTDVKAALGESTAPAQPQSFTEVVFIESSKS